MLRSDTMTRPHRHARAAAAATATLAALLFLFAAGLAVLAGDAVRQQHAAGVAAAFGAAGAALAVAGIVLALPGLSGRLACAARRRPPSAPAAPAAPAGPTPLPDDLYDTAVQIVDRTLAVSSLDLAVVAAGGIVISDEQANDLGIAMMRAHRAVDAAGRWTPAVNDMHRSLLNACAPAADAFLATLAADLITPDVWQTLTAVYRKHDMSPALTAPAQTHGGRR